MPFRTFLTLILIILSPAAMAMPTEVTVHLFESHPLCRRVNLEGPFQIVEAHKSVPTGHYYCEGADGILHMRSNDKKHALRIDGRTFVLRSLRPDQAGIGVQYSTSAHRRYRGLLKLSTDHANNVHVDNTVAVRDYVTSVVGSESDPEFPSQCLQAQAILTLTRVSQLTARDSFGDSTQQESYFGCDYERPLVKQAVESAWGSTLTYKNQPIHVFYHSTCAGKTSCAADVFGDGGKNMPYAKCVVCDFCKQSPFWKSTLTRIPLSRFKAEFGAVPVVETLDCAARPKALTLKKIDKTVDLSGYQFWIQLGQKFGWDKAPGTRFKLKEVSDQLQVESTGAGHGVGMCQWGAAGMARQGKTCQEILKYYYPGTTISRRHQ